MILHQYTNGNTIVTLHDNGTKERVFNGTPNVIHPESIDVKITNYCDAGCGFCHEQSTIAGRHADLNELFKVLSVLPAGVEIAIGGGNPLSHPDLIPFLERVKKHGLVCNITVNQKHLEPYKGLIAELIERVLVRGFGISYTSEKYLKDIKPIASLTDNIVFHVIMGINKVNDVKILKEFCAPKECKILVLGYKRFGLGINYYLKNKRIEDNKYDWYTQLALLFKDNNLTLSFDNLAIKQLDLRRYFTDAAWGEFYMGDDFVFTMYIDAVNKQYAPSSTSDNRVSFADSSLLNYFGKHGGIVSES